MTRRSEADSEVLLRELFDGDSGVEGEMICIGKILGKIKQTL
jgi:hypothetical protein